MNPARRATPDSEAVASSEDEKPWPSSMKFGNFSMKENSVPGLPGGIWSTRNQRGSFKMSEEAKLTAARHTRLGALNTTIRAATTPSPSASEGATSLPFAIPLQPTPKTGRSLSHSMGQREGPSTSGPHANPNPGGHATAALPLGLLAEEADTESESDLGPRLTHTTSHPPIGSLMRTATLPSTFHHGHGHGHGHGKDYGYGKDYVGDQSPQLGLVRGKTFEASFATLSLEQPGQRARWQSHLGWDDVTNVNESRRHSLADIPTRRGSLAAGEPSLLSRTFTHDPLGIDHHLPTHFHQAVEHSDRSLDSGAEHHPNMTRAQDTAAALDIPLMYRVPYVELNPSERREVEARRAQEQPPPVSWGPGAGRPRKQLFVVSFKCSRVDVFYLLDNTGLNIKEGDLVIVEADRGQDLGTVQHARVTPDAAKLYKKKYSEEQYKWLMMYSRNKDGGYNPNAQVHGESSAMGPALFPDAPATMQGTIPRDNYNNLKPKAIKRLANDHEIKMLAEKEGNEAKAKRTCQQKVAHLRLHMEILDAEWQWDFQKLIFYYYADHYINFKDLITELYRIYKTRIWLSAINPASFSQHAMGQPPSGIGPGAVAPYNPYANNSSYTMTYGEDRDPYGAQMPYRIPYETYTPNYPAIPGVANSFAPPAFNPNTDFMFFPQTGGQGEDLVPTTNPLINRTGAISDYNLFYNRSGQQEQFAVPNVTQPDEDKLRAQQQAIRDAGSYNPTQPVGPYHTYPFGMDGGTEETSGPSFTNPWNAAAQYSASPTAGSSRQAYQTQAPIGTRPTSQGIAGQLSEQSSHAAHAERVRQACIRNTNAATAGLQSFTREQIFEQGPHNSNGKRDGSNQVADTGIGSEDPSALLGRYFTQPSADVHRGGGH